MLWLCGVALTAALTPSALSAQTESETQPFTEADYDANARQALERDAFPVLDNPATVMGRDVGAQIDANEMVIGIEVNGVARAYPIAVMGKHELANDELGDAAITVSW
jgi:hypothetical protein